MARNQGDMYTNKYLFPLGEGWDLNTINAFLDANNLRRHQHANNFSEASMERYIRENRFFVIYTHIEKDNHEEVRTAAVVPSEIHWYTERGWVNAPHNFKMEIPY